MSGLRDFLHGHIWEDGERVAGFTQFSRRGTTDTWVISAVGVHPDFRRRGIAQQLVKAAVEFIQGRGGKRITLDVIEGNVPALNLYAKLGFENFSANLETHLTLESAPAKPPLPAGYSLESIDDYAWQDRYALMQRTTPQTIIKIEFNVPIWQQALVTAAEEAGFKTRVKLLTFGLLL